MLWREIATQWSPPWIAGRKGESPQEQLPRGWGSQTLKLGGSKSTRGLHGGETEAYQIRTFEDMALSVQILHFAYLYMYMYMYVYIYIYLNVCNITSSWPSCLVSHGDLQKFLASFGPPQGTGATLKSTRSWRMETLGGITFVNGGRNFGRSNFKSLKWSLSYGGFCGIFFSEIARWRKIWGFR